EVSCQRSEQLPELVSLRVFDLSAEESGGHLVGLVADDQVPSAVGDLEFQLDIVVARQLIEPSDHQVRFKKPVAGPGCFKLVVGQNLKRQMEASIKLVLPLLGEATRADDQATVKVAAGDQFLHQKAGHDCLTGARIIGQEKTQRLAGQHGFIDRGDLVRQW